MKNRTLPQITRRMPFLKLSLFAVLGVAACASDPAPTSEPAAPAPQVTSEAVAREAEADPSEAPRMRGPGGHLFERLESLDLTDAQRADLDAIRGDLEEDLAPTKEDIQKLVLVMADGLEAGRIDREAISQQRAIIAAALPSAKIAIGEAANAVHATLTPEQRAELVLTMRARGDEWRERGAHAGAGHARAAGEGECRGGPLSKIALELGLTDDQKLAITDSAKKIMEELFPERQVRREEWEADMKALGDAFMTADFDAHAFDLMKHAPDLAAASAGATVVAEVAVKILTRDQRTKIAARIRTRATKS
jgi:Spy/CpxP family protein refolding chaperone